MFSFAKVGLLLVLAGAMVTSPVSAEESTSLAFEQLAHVSEEDEKDRPRDSETTVTLEEVVVEGRRPSSAASSETIRARDYELRPHATTQEILNNVPGVVVAQHQGGGKATQYLVRGFDADHGTDFALSVDGIPVNLVTHGHGQGYADLNFLIPETVDRLKLYKGPYFTELGDFATAGALQIVTKKEFEESFARAEGGSFDTQRYVVGLSPHLDWAKTLLAAEAYFSNGPFTNEQNLARYNVLGKLAITPSAQSELTFSISSYATDWDASGQVPARLVREGTLYVGPGQDDARSFGRFDAIDPSEGGKSDRQNLNIEYKYAPGSGEEWQAQVWASRYSLRLYSDFTFFQDTGLRFRSDSQGGVVDACAGVGTGQDCPVDTSQVYIPGDGITQDDSRLLFGGRLKYSRNWQIAGFAGQSALGLETRRDDIRVSLRRQVQRQSFFTVNDVTVAEQSVAGFLQHHIHLTEWARLEAGLRGDVYFFDARDHLPNQGPDADFEAVRVSGNKTESIVSPKASLVLGPFYDSEMYLNFGSGFHSNDARSVLRTGRDGLVRALGSEVGVRTRQLDRLDLAAALWLIDSDSELTFSGDGGDVDADLVDGVFQAGPASRRWGIDFEARYEILQWLHADYDLSWADPRIRSTGEAVPLAPTLLMNGGLTAELDNGFSAALRFRFLDDRPANADRSLTAQGYGLVDLLAKYRWRNVEASLALLNLTDTSWREAQFANTSCVRGDIGNDPRCLEQGGGEGIEDVHFTPGNPFAARGGVTVYF